MNMNNLELFVQDGKVLADSRKVAEMISKRHDHLVRDIDGYVDAISENPKLGSQNFFIESTYKADGNNKTYKRYSLTKQGCEMVANKLTGKKGILFTATYVQQFNNMENELSRPRIDHATNDKKLEIQKKRVETMAMNANTKRAKVMADLARVAVLPSYQNTLIVSAANILAGKQIIALPTSESGRERHPLGWYCKLVGKKETWATQMGKILKQHGVDKIHGKTGELVEFIDDGKHQRQTFEWYTDYLMPIVKKNFSLREEEKN
jgi:Rha family phage regulatory protein